MARTDIVFIPSQLLTADLWSAQRVALRDIADTMVADHTRADTIAGIAQTILADSPERFTLVAHGMGGFVAFEIMRTAPQRVGKLALFATLASADTPAQTERRMGYLRLVESGKFAQVVEERIPMMIPEDRRGEAKLVDLVRKMALDTGAETFLRQQRAIMGRIDSRPRLNEIRCPTLLVYGAHDKIGNMGYQEEMRDGIPGARLEVLEDAGHLIPIERPERANTLLRDFIAG
jgi:pimeloyl-ACP methyl ester carboxylesterase